jgi:hypothetical protein
MIPARVLGVDIGARAGFGLLTPDEFRSGSFGFLDKWFPLGQSCITWEAKMREKIQEYRPEHIALARQFLRPFKDGKVKDSPVNLIPLYWGFATVAKIGAEMGVRVHWEYESDARLLLLGKGNMPAKSEPLKKAVWEACRSRGWRCCDYNASDATCLAAAVVEKLNKGAGHQTAPLFLAAKDEP